MADPVLYAQLADVVYQDVRGNVNQTPEPGNWTQLSYTSAGRAGLLGRLPRSGFAAGVYQSGNEIVIAYAGTNPDALSADGILDWGNNIAAGTGLLAEQIVDAAELYLRVKSHYTNDETTITFTGHSLGGGLASLMAVYFNKNATVSVSGKALYD